MGGTSIGMPKTRPHPVASGGPPSPTLQLLFSLWFILLISTTLSMMIGTAHAFSTTSNSFIVRHQRKHEEKSSSCVVLSMNNVFGNAATTRQSSSDKEKDADRLLELLLDKRRKELEPRSVLDTILSGRFFTSQENFNDSDMMIQELIERLIDNNTSEQNRYDPTTCLLGPLYATLYSYTPNANTAPDPLWKRISIFSAENIQGQQYYEDESTQQKVVNYSEIFSSSLYLEARGSFTESVRKSVRNSDPKGRNLLDYFFAATTQLKTPAGLRTCPDSYDVTVTQASICFFGGKTKLNVPIQGQSILRVLYASPQLRIFVSPLDNTDEAGTQWESSGLIVVQVRSDLLEGVAEPLDIR